MPISVLITRYVVRTVVLGGALVMIVLLVFGYARDVVRLFTVTQIQTAIELSHDRSGAPGYPASLQDIVGPHKILSQYPRDPIVAFDWNAVNVLLQKLGIPDSFIDTHVTEAYGYRYIYRVSPDRHDYDLSTRLESVFMARRMQQDGGGDNSRYEVGSNIKTNPVVIGSGSNTSDVSVRD